MLSEGVSPPSGDTKTVFHAGFVMEVKQNLTATYVRTAAAILPRVPFKLPPHTARPLFSGMLRIKFADQNDPKDPGQQSDQLTQEIAAGSYNLNIELDAQQLGLGPASKKVIPLFPLLGPSHTRFLPQEGDTANYLLTVLLCEGECGSAHKWSRILAGNSSEFNVTKTK
jgi:hypothetical protein